MAPPRLLPWVLLLASCRGSGSRADESRADLAGRRYDVERGLVEYALDGMERGTETLRFKNFGRQQVTQKRVELDLGIALGPANTGPQEIVSIVDGTTVVNYDPKERTGTRTLNSLELLGGDEKFKGKHLFEVTKSMFVSMGGKVIGNKTIAGLPCEVWKIEKLGTETCLHKGLTLEVTTALAGMKQHSVATRVDWNAAIDDALFVVPKDVSLVESDLKEMKRLQQGAATASPGGTLSPDDAVRLLRESAPAQ